MNAGFLLNHDHGDWPRLTVKSGEVIIKPHTSTDHAYILESGTAKATNSSGLLISGDLLLAVEFLVCETYSQRIIAKDTARLIILARDDIKNLLTRSHDLTWSLSCMLAADIIKRDTNQAAFAKR
jgi:glyoxylase-like metal-dependent hydrolase (beta-lactamase superfamily II)